MDAIQSLPKLATELADGLVLILLLSMALVVIFAGIRSLTPRSPRVDHTPTPVNAERRQCLRSAQRWSARGQTSNANTTGSGDSHISVGQRPPH